MVCCCKINCKGLFGIIFANLAAILLFASFLSCSWLTNDYHDAHGNATNTGIVCPPTEFANLTMGSAGNETNYNKVLTYVAPAASIISALSLFVLGDLFLAVYCSCCCCFSCGIITSGGLHIASSLFSWLGSGIFTYGVIHWTEYMDGKPNAADFGWSFYMSWIAGLVLFLGGLLETQGVNPEDYTTSSTRKHAKQPEHVVMQPRATMNPAYAAYDF